MELPSASHKETPFGWVRLLQSVAEKRLSGRRPEDATKRS